MKKTLRPIVLIIVLAALVLSSGLLVSAQDDSDGTLTIGYAVHSDPSGSFWDVVTRGARDAAEDLGIELLVGGSSDPLQQAQLVENYITQGVDGIIVSLANPDAMRDAVTRAVDAGIPVITINSGAGVFRELGALTHVGQTEFVAGQGAGERLNEEGVSRVLCVIHEEGNIGLEERCAGLEDTFNGEVERFNVATTGVMDLAGTQSSIQDRLISDASIDAILTLNPDVGIAARDAISGAGTAQTLATFDLSADVLRAIEGGEIAFAIDQQQYLQGYLPVVFLQLYNQNLNTVGGGNPVLTGPGFVTAENASQVIELSAQGTR
jgi:simple sugar transport system substrate-binding protein